MSNLSGLLNGMLGRVERSSMDNQKKAMIYRYGLKGIAHWKSENTTGQDMDEVAKAYGIACEAIRVQGTVEIKKTRDFGVQTKPYTEYPKILPLDYSSVRIEGILSERRTVKGDLYLVRFANCRGYNWVPYCIVEGTDAMKRFEEWEKGMGKYKSILQKADREERGLKKVTWADQEAERKEKESTPPMQWEIDLDLSRRPVLRQIV